MNKKWKVSLGIVAGLIVVAIIIIMSPLARFVLSGGFGTEEQPFNSEEWKRVASAAPSEMRVRLLMLEDLVENQLRDDMDSTSVKAMLGEPYRKYGFAYGLGELTPGMDPLIMILEFDESGKFERMNVKRERDIE